MYLVTRALQHHVTYLYTPSEAITNQLPTNTTFRLGGIVTPGTFHTIPGTLHTQFDVSDAKTHILVLYNHILPHLFREGQAIIASGHLNSGVFIADEVLARHNETYTPYHTSKHPPHSATASGCDLNSPWCHQPMLGQSSESH